MENELAKKPQTVQDWLQDDKVQKHLARLLPKHVRADQFLALAGQCVKRTPKLRECSVSSMLCSLTTAARLGLSVDGPAGGAHLVPFRNKGTMECQLMPDYRGLQKLARQTQDVKMISASVVYECDEFSFQRGTDPKIVHVPKDWPTATEPSITHCYAIAWYRGESMPQFEVLQVAEIEKVRASAKSSTSQAWVHWFGEMGKKTAFKRLGKWLPSSAELLKAISLDDQVEAGIPQDLDIVDITTEPSVPKADSTPTEPPQATLPAEVVDSSTGTERPAEGLSDDLYNKLYAAAMAIPEKARAKVLEGFGLSLATSDARALDAATANDLVVALRDAKGSKPLPEFDPKVDDGIAF